jgi:hypothetical protein
MSPDTGAGMRRRRFLATLAGTGVASSLAGCSLLAPGRDASTTSLTDDRARALAERFAPTMYFDEAEPWLPTDPRDYETTRDGEPVVDGFAALDGYTEAYDEEPPSPTVFYHAVTYEASPLAAVQFWYYSAFDQFTTNFHWHDWEVLHVFVDTDTGEPQLYVASSHSGRVPNNEFLDPDPERTPRILSELGSHSSALSVNDAEDEFQRLPLDGALADITNRGLEGLGDLAELPIAYGLPRDEGSPLPYVVPELNGQPVYQDERLPSVGRSDLIDERLTVRSFDALDSLPTNLPARETGLVFAYEGRSADADVEYELHPTAAVEHITGFTGPQLSFEFAVPEFAEDAIANHISTAGVPWEQPRYDAPAADISDPNHRAALAERYDAIGEPPPANTVVADVAATVSNDDAPDGEGVTTEALGVEAVALLESEPDAVPTFRGLVVARGVPEGDHRLTVNAAGAAPHAETVRVDGDEGTTSAGVGGEVPLVAREAATKLEVDTEGTDAELTDLAVEDDFAGRLYDAPLSGPDAVYVHRGGAYTAEVRDADDEVGAFRANPDDESRVRIEEPRTGKAPLAAYLADVAEETVAAVASVTDGADGNSDDDAPSGGPDGVAGIDGLVNALEAVAEAARRAAERAEAGDGVGADRRLEAVQRRLETVAARLEEAEDELPAELGRAVGRRLEQSRRRSEQARAAEKL